MKPRRLLAMCLCVSAAAGCTVGPNYSRPNVSLPTQYMGGSQPGPSSASAAAAYGTQWWDGFNDPGLTSFVSMALDQNLSIEQALARVTQVRAGLGAANAAMLPTGSVTGQAGRASQSLETPLGRLLNASPGYNRRGSSYELDLGVSWEVDFFGGLKRLREAAKADYEASQAAVAATRLAIAAQTADTYINIRSLQTRLAIAKKQVDTSQQIFDKFTLLYQRGLVPEQKLRQAEAALSQAESAVPALQAELNSTMNALDVLVGAPAGTFRSTIEVVKEVPTPPQIATNALPGDILRRRPDVFVAEKLLIASNARIGSAIAEYYPKVSVSGMLGSATSIASSNLFTSGANQAAASAGLRWRLFDFGRIDAEIKVAEGRNAEALATYKLSILKAGEDVENALSEISNRQRQTASLTQSEVSLANARESAEAGYKKGISSQIEVLQAEQARLLSADAKTQAQAGSARATVAAFKAFGGGWTAS